MHPLRFQIQNKPGLQNSKGMTLTELMVTVSIVAILAAMAIPAYTHFTRKAQMLEGEVSLRIVEKLQEAYFIQHEIYSDNLVTIGFVPLPPLQYYTVAVTLGDNKPIAYQATATALSPQLGSFMLTKYADGRADYLQVSTSGSGSDGSGSGGSGGGSGGETGGGSGGGDTGGGGGDSDGGGKDKKDKEKKDKEKKDKKDK